VALLLKVFAGWIATVVIVALTTAVFFAQGVYAPSRFNLDDLQTYESGINSACREVAEKLLSPEVQASVAERIEEFQYIKQDISSDQVDFLNDVLQSVVDTCAIR